MFSARAKVFEVMPQMPGNKVLTIFGEFRVKKIHNDAVECVQWNPQESNSANRLGERAESLQSNANKKTFMKNRS